jgi:5,10-methylenetetrahydromethanopterin reductase
MMPGASKVTWGVGCWQTHVLGDLVGEVEAAEKGGFNDLWYGNEKLHPDMWIGLAAAALHSSRVRVGTFIADPYTIHPAITASMIATLDHFSGGRAVLVLGAGGSGLHELGLERKRPLEAIETAVRAIRELLSGGRVVQQGPLFAADAQLHFAARADIPIWIATRAERMLALAGRIADGVMIGTIARADDLRDAVDRIRSGAEDAGRDPSAVTLCARVDVSIGNDRTKALDALRRFVAGVLSASYPDRGFVERARLAVPDELERICATKDLRLAWASAHLVPDELVDAFTWAGTPDDVARRIVDAVKAGIEEVTVVFHSEAGPTREQITRFSETVIPRVDALLGQSVLSATNGVG